MGAQAKERAGASEDQGVGLRDGLVDLDALKERELRALAERRLDEQIRRAERFSDLKRQGKHREAEEEYRGARDGDMSLADRMLCLQAWERASRRLIASLEALCVELAIRLGSLEDEMARVTGEDCDDESRTRLAIEREGLGFLFADSRLPALFQELGRLDESAVELAS